MSEAPGFADFAAGRVPWAPLELGALRDERGGLGIVEAGQTVPFEIKRVYYLYDVPADRARGAHAHRVLKQLFLALSGSFRLRCDDGRREQSFVLERPDQGVLVGPMVWRELDTFSPGAVCCVLASEHYDESDYFRVRGDFLAAVRGER